MSDVVIKVENLSKQYRLGTVGTGTLSHDLNRFWAKLRGKEDPYLKIGESNDRTSKGESDYVWALKNINFEVKQGEVLGIIGRNGAGKSTLLKILSQITRPTTGTIKMRGRVGSLLEVGTGFHPDLTGRENIYINGAILGMRKWEIDKKLDQIIDFAGVERYIDTPVKRYSSGMKVRLGFSVAAHLEPEILIVDEVLAVGDAEFQKKCLGKMGEVSKNDGRTILFVSHNLSAIEGLCSNLLVVQNGANIPPQSIESGLSTYLDQFQKTSGIHFDGVEVDDGMNLESLTIGGESEGHVSPMGELFIEATFQKKNEGTINLKDISFDIGVSNRSGIRVAWFSSLTSDCVYDVQEISQSDKFKLKFTISCFNLAVGPYSVTIHTTHKSKVLFRGVDIYRFEILDRTQFDGVQLRRIPPTRSYVLFKPKLRIERTL